MTVSTGRPLVAFWGPLDDWTPSTFKEAVKGLVSAGYNGIRLTGEWTWMQTAGPDQTDFSTLDWAVETAVSGGLEVSLTLDHSCGPPWVDAGEYGMRDQGGKQVSPLEGTPPMVALNSRQILEWVDAWVRSCVEHFSGVDRFQCATTPAGESTLKIPGHGVYDHSKWAAEAYRAWVRAKYIDIRMLNDSWETSYKGWDEVEVGEGTIRCRLADWHTFRAVTLTNWTDSLRKAVHAARGGATLEFRSGTHRMHADLYLHAFDLGRYVRAADSVMADGALDPFIINMVRSSAEMWTRGWGVRLERGAFEEAMEPARVNEEMLKWGKGVYSLGGRVEVDHRPGAPEWLKDPAWTFQPELHKLAAVPPPPPKNNRRAIYVSAAEAQYWDGTDYDAARDRWNEVTQTGAKPQVDVVSDGMFLGAPDVLKRYSAGVESPFAKVMARETRSAVTQAMRLGVRFMFYNPKMAGSMDEYGRPQTPFGT